MPIATDDRVDIGWIGIRDRALRPIERSFLDCMTRQLHASQGESFFLWSAIGSRYIPPDEKCDMLTGKKTKLPVSIFYGVRYEPVDPEASGFSAGERKI